MTRHRTADLEPMEFGGRYTLLRRLAVGGMAEIYLARQAAMAGFEKEVVIKKLRAELADDPRIVEMFLDEAKIGAQLNHPNIVHVYDVDEHDGIPYIAMEYIVGEELNELCRRGITYGRFLPLEHAVEVMRQAAAGMGYFHAKRGAEGSAQANQPLDIVHLDISPSNLLVTQDGFMKVIDFGIARARGQNVRTEVLPGKLSYMSPEQAARKDVDHRSDIFSLGIVLYEITVGKRLYRGPAAEVVHALIDGEVEPPTFARRNFPPALESIVMRTLEKHPEDRYQSAYDLADDLESFLRDERLHSGPVRIARYLDMLALAAGGARRPELISEAEARGGADELDFDSQVFDGFAPSEGAPGPEQAPMWEDVDQPESEVAKALQIDLAELRALRTPVPMRPAGMAAVRGSGALAAVAPPDDGDTDDAPPTAPVPRMRTSEVYGDDDAVPELPAGDDESVDVDIQTPPKPFPAVPQPAPPDPRLGAEAAARLLGSASHRAAYDGAAPQPVADKPSIGAAYLARSQDPSRKPWLVSVLLGVVVLALLAYIVIK
ncbi:MAG: protein kinase [Deltaproteobacteria bacterium]